MLVFHIFKKIFSQRVVYVSQRDVNKSAQKSNQHSRDCTRVDIIRVYGPQCLSDSWWTGMLRRKRPFTANMPSGCCARPLFYETPICTYDSFTYCIS